MPKDYLRYFCTQMEFQSWDSWGADDVSFNHSNGPGPHGDIGRYGNRAQLQSEDDPEVDFFQDMTPEFKKAAKVSGDYVESRECFSYARVCDCVCCSRPIACSY